MRSEQGELTKSPAIIAGLIIGVVICFSFVFSHIIRNIQRMAMLSQSHSVLMARRPLAVHGKASHISGTSRMGNFSALVV